MNLEAFGIPTEAEMQNETPSAEANAANNEQAATSNEQPATDSGGVGSQNADSQTQAAQNETPAVETPSFASDEIAEINRFVAKTGKTAKDFFELKTPTSELSEKDLISKYLTEQGKDKKEINEVLEGINIDEDDSDFYEDAEFKELKEKKENLLSEAKTWRENMLKEVFSNDTASAQTPAAENTSAKGDDKTELLTMIYAADKDLTDVPIDFDGSTHKFKISDEMRKEVRQSIESAVNLMNLRKEDLVDVKSIFAETAWGNSKTRAELLNYVIEQAKASERLKMLAELRNVDFADYGRDAPETNMSEAAQADAYARRKMAQKNFIND